MTAARPPGLIQRYREELQARHYARRTVKTYEQWLRRFLRFHGLRHPRQMGSAEVNAFLTHLAVDLQVSASTQNQALAALERMGGVEALVAGLLYGSGLRLMEALRLRVKDLADGYGRVQLPHALSRKYPHAPVEWGWQWVFSQHHRWRDPATGQQGRHHLDPRLVQKAVRNAVTTSRGMSY